MGAAASSEPQAPTSLSSSSSSSTSNDAKCITPASPKKHAHVQSHTLLQMPSVPPSCASSSLGSASVQISNTNKPCSFSDTQVSDMASAEHFPDVSSEISLPQPGKDGGEEDVVPYLPVNRAVPSDPECEYWRELFRYHKESSYSISVNSLIPAVESAGESPYAARNVALALSAAVATLRSSHRDLRELGVRNTSKTNNADAALAFADALLSAVSRAHLSNAHFRSRARARAALFGALHASLPERDRADIGYSALWQVLTSALDVPGCPRAARILLHAFVDILEEEVEVIDNGNDDDDDERAVRMQDIVQRYARPGAVVEGLLEAICEAEEKTTQNVLRNDTLNLAHLRFKDVKAAIATPVADAVAALSARIVPRTALTIFTQRAKNSPANVSSTKQEYVQSTDWETLRVCASNSETHGNHRYCQVHIALLSLVVADNGVYARALRALHDAHAAAAPPVSSLSSLTSSASTSNSNNSNNNEGRAVKGNGSVENAASFNFDRLYNALCTACLHPWGTLLLHIILQRSRRFMAYTRARTDPDGLLLPLLSTLHSSIAPEIPFSDAFAILGALLSLTADPGFCAAMDEIAVHTWKLSWLEERTRFGNARLSLSALVMFVCARTVHSAVTGRQRANGNATFNAHTHNKMDCAVAALAMAVMANVAAHASRLHPLPADRLVALVEFLARRQRKLKAMDSDDSDNDQVGLDNYEENDVEETVPIGRGDTNELEDVTQLLALSLEVLCGALKARSKGAANRHLIYALLHREQTLRLNEISQISVRCNALCTRISALARFFARRVENIQHDLHADSASTAASNEATTANVVSVAAVYNVIDRAARTLPPDILGDLPDMRFEGKETYQDEKGKSFLVWQTAALIARFVQDAPTHRLPPVPVHYRHAIMPGIDTGCKESATAFTSLAPHPNSVTGKNR